MKTLFNSLLFCAAFITASAVGTEKSCCHKPLAASAPLPDASLYQVTSYWTNDTSVPLTLGSLRGKPQVVTMFFASCEFACPLLVNDMKRIEAALPATVRTNVGFVLISFDTQRDTPEALAKFRKEHALNANWTLLRGASEDVLEISALLGVKYKKDARGQFAHSNLITLLNANGEVVTRQVGLNQDGGDIVGALNSISTTP